MPTHEIHPVVDQCLTGRIGRMGLAGENQLHRPLRMIQQARQALRVMQQQIGSLVRRESPCEAHRQYLRIEQALGAIELDRRAARNGELQREPPARVLDQRSARGRPALPDRGVGCVAN